MVYRFRLIFVAMIALAGLIAPAAPLAQASTDRPLIAFYYPWYELSDWSTATMLDLPNPRYSGGDDAAMRRHLQQAADAGIDALVCAWFGPGEDRINKRCRRLLQLAEEQGKVKVAIMPEQAAWASLNNVNALASAIGVVQREMMGSPAYFRYQGKPVLVYFGLNSLGGVDTWVTLRNQADPNREQYWFGGSDVFDHLRAFDALYYYDITWERSQGAAMASYARRLGDWNRANGQSRPFVATVMPGYDDLRIRPAPVGHSRDRENGNYYRGTWQTAIDRRADVVMLTSFNEFKEGSFIEPSDQFGDLYLRLTRELSDRFNQAMAGGSTTPAQPQPQPQPSGPCRMFAETGHQVCGRILEYWNQNGGLPVFGYPITPQKTELVEGKALQVQVFERNRLELHPENARPYDVLLGRLGADRLVARKIDWQQFPKANPNAANYFPQTGQAIAPEFYGYWSSQGLEFDSQPGKSFEESLALFGLPLSPAQMEVSQTDGGTYLTQHFERARFEYHPENAGTPYVVLLGLLGRETTGIR
ncbi:MAG: hypothetical protein Fur005_21530 [Roseiflexaceae bacterium]